MRFGATKILTNDKVAYKQKIKYVDIEALEGYSGLKSLSKDFLKKKKYFKK